MTTTFSSSSPSHTNNIHHNTESTSPEDTNRLQRSAGQINMLGKQHLINKYNHYVSASHLFFFSFRYEWSATSQGGKHGSVIRWRDFPGCMALQTIWWIVGYFLRFFSYSQDAFPLEHRVFTNTVLSLFHFYSELHHTVILNSDQQLPPSTISSETHLIHWILISSLLTSWYGKSSARVC